MVFLDEILDNNRKQKLEAVEKLRQEALLPPKEVPIYLLWEEWKKTITHHDTPCLGVWEDVTSTTYKQLRGAYSNPEKANKAKEDLESALKESLSKGDEYDQLRVLSKYGIYSWKSSSYDYHWELFIVKWNAPTNTLFDNENDAFWLREIDKDKYEKVRIE